MAAEGDDGLSQAEVCRAQGNELLSKGDYADATEPGWQPVTATILRRGRASHDGLGCEYKSCFPEGMINGSL